MYSEHLTPEFKQEQRSLTPTQPDHLVQVSPEKKKQIGNRRGNSVSPEKPRRQRISDDDDSDEEPQGSNSRSRGKKRKRDDEDQFVDEFNIDDEEDDDYEEVPDSSWMNDDDVDEKGTNIPNETDEEAGVNEDEEYVTCRMVTRY